MERLDPAGFDGVIAKRLGEPYRPGSREAVVKVKRHRTADCAVIGVRFAEKDGRIATLLLGLYDDAGELRYVGTAAVAPARHDEIAELVLPLRADAPERRFSEPNRWGSGELEQASVRPELVVEVRLRQVAAHALSARNAASALPARQGAGAVHGRPGTAPPQSGRPDRLGAARSLIRTRKGRKSEPRDASQRDSSCALLGANLEA